MDDDEYDGTVCWFTISNVITSRAAHIWQEEEGACEQLFLSSSWLVQETAPTDTCQYQ